MSTTPTSQQGRGIGTVAQYYLSSHQGELESVSAGRRGPGETGSAGESAGDGKSQDGLSREGESSAEQVETVGKEQNNSETVEKKMPDEQAAVYGVEDLIRERLEEENESSSESKTVIMLAADHLKGGDLRVEQYAEQCAYEEGHVGLICRRGNQVQVTELWGGELTIEDIDETEVKCEGGYDLLEMLVDLGDRCGTLFVEVEGGDFAERPELIRGGGQVLVFSTGEPGEMVGAYKNIKQLVQMGLADKTGLFVSGVEDTDQALRIYEKLAQTCREFLGLELEWAGYEEEGGPVRRRELCRIEADEQAMTVLIEYVRELGEEAEREEMLQAEGAVLLEEMSKEQEEAEIEGTIEVKPVEEEQKRTVERETAAQEEHAGETAAVREGNAGETPAVREGDVGETPALQILRGKDPPDFTSGARFVAGETAAVREEKPMPLAPVAVRKLPRDDEELTEALQLSLGSWLRAVPAGMVVPISLPKDVGGGVRVLIDGNGRLYVWAASLTGAGVWERAMRGRKWVVDNLELIIAHGRQLRIDRSLEVGIILVGGGAIEGLRQSGLQIGEFPCVVLQLHLLQNEEGCWLLVV